MSLPEYVGPPHRRPVLTMLQKGVASQGGATRGPHRHEGHQALRQPLSHHRHWLPRWHGRQWITRNHKLLPISRRRSPPGGPV